MTEQEWHTTGDMNDSQYESFLHSVRGIRKLRLLACAFARQVLHVTSDKRAADLLSLAERCIDLPELDPTRSNARREMQGWYRDILPKSARFAVSAVYYALSSGSSRDCFDAAHVARRAMDYAPELKKAQDGVLRCIFGNPFHPIVFDPRWRTETVVALASGTFEDRAFDRLPILADALVEAGCDYPDVLSHCRGPGPHARGCWVVDGVLGKE